LASDVEVKQKRFEAAQERKRLLAIKATIPALEQELKAAEDKLNAALEELRPPVNEAFFKLKDAREQADRIHSAETILRTTGVPLELKQRNEALLSKKRKLREMRELYEERTNEAIKALRHFDYLRERLDKEIGNNTAGSQRKVLKAERDSLDSQREPYERQINAHAQLAEEIASLTKWADTEQATIDKLLMTP
jgi:non-ribosomal peptide synthetase component F